MRPTNIFSSEKEFTPHSNMVSFNPTERGKLGNKVWSTQKLETKPLSCHHQEDAQKQSTPNPTRSALPASHHHLDVLPLLFFLLHGGIRLGRHDGTLGKIKAGRWPGLGCPPFLPSAAWPGDRTQAAQRPWSPLGTLTGRGVCSTPAGAGESPISSQPKA